MQPKPTQPTRTRLEHLLDDLDQAYEHRDWKLVKQTIDKQRRMTLAMDTRYAFNELHKQLGID